jgi:transcription elongation factor GreA
MKHVQLTPEGVAELQTELERLITVERKRVIDSLADARALGDLSENAEYDAARDQQGLIESRIAEIELVLAQAQIVQHAAVPTGTVGFGSTVTVDVEGDEEKYMLVGEAEADLAKGKISTDSPLGLALLGKKVGDVVKVEVPGVSTLAYTIKEVK